jgi:hypothetical protein
LVGDQNKFSSPPTAFETRGRNVTVCPETYATIILEKKSCPATYQGDTWGGEEEKLLLKLNLGTG